MFLKPSFNKAAPIAQKKISNTPKFPTKYSTQHVPSHAPDIVTPNPFPNLKTDLVSLESIQSTASAIPNNKNVHVAGSISVTNIKRNYSHIQDPSNIGVRKNFTPKQKKLIMAEHLKRNGGIYKSDLSGTELVPPKKSRRGVTPPKNEYQVDHIVPKDKGGTNSFSNAQVLSREENRKKWNK